MKNVIKFLLVVSSFSLFACSGQREVIKLNLDNYTNYFDISSVQVGEYTQFEISGCLSFALYENVVLSIQYSIGAGSNNYIKEDYKLNAAGNGRLYKYNLSILDVSGKVILFDNNY